MLHSPLIGAENLTHDDENFTDYDYDKFFKEFDYNGLVEAGAAFTKIWMTQSALVIFSNLVCLYIITAAKGLKRSYSNWFLIGVMVSHIIKGCSLIIFIQDVYKEVFFDMFVDSMALSLIFLTLLTVDRYLAIKHTFLYHTLTWRYATLALGISVVPWIGFVVFVYISSQNYNGCQTVTVLGVITLAVGILLIFSNYNVYREARRQLASIASTTIRSTDQQRKVAQDRMKKRKLKAIGICMLITMSFIVFWLPYFVFTFLDLAGALDAEAIVKFWLHMGSWFCGGLNSVIDPIIYEYFNKDIRRYLRKGVCRPRKKASKYFDTHVSECTL